MTDTTHNTDADIDQTNGHATPLPRLILDAACGVAVALVGAWIIRAGLGQAGYGPVPSLWASGSILVALASLLCGMALLGAGAWLINRVGEHLLGEDFYLGGLAVGVVLAVMLFNTPGLETWLRELPTPTGALYLKLALEALLWQACLLAVLVLGTRLPKPWDKPVSSRTHTQAHTPQHIDFNQVRLNRWSSRTWYSGAVSLAVFLIFTRVLMRTPGAAQSILAACCAGFLAAVVARLSFPSRNPLAIYLAPLVVTQMVYLYAAMTLNAPVPFLEAWNLGQLPGIASALPCHLAVGSFVGLLIGCLLVNKANEADAAQG